MSRAGLSDLFRERSNDDRERLENFTSAALALAINSDPAPFLRVLDTVAGWAPDSTARAHAGQLKVELGSVSAVAAKTQVSLFGRPEIAETGALDLVVTLGDARGSTQELWVEVKVDAPLTLRGTESDGRPRDQLDVYMAHRPLDREGSPDDPFIVTLAKDVVRHDVAALRWLDIYAAARASSDNFMWQELATFLEQYAIVSPPLPPDLADWSPFVPVFVAVNREMRRLWPPDTVAVNMHTTGVEKQLKFYLKAQGRLMLTAACISYGLREAGGRPEWWIAVADGSGYPNRLRLPIEDVVAAAPPWFRERWTVIETFWVDRTDIYEKRRPMGVDRDEAIEWLSAALREIHESKVIEPYLAARRQKTTTRVFPYSEPG